MNTVRNGEIGQKLADGLRTIMIGGTGIATISLDQVKDAMSIIVAAITVLCLIYNTFFKKGGVK